MIETARALIAEHLSVPTPRIVHGATFRELGADSLDLVSLTMAFEEAFDLQIPDDQAESCETVGDAIGLLEQCVKLRRGACGVPSEPVHAAG
jgi:acyl carrier protein